MRRPSRPRVSQHVGKPVRAFLPYFLRSVIGAVMRRPPCRVCGAACGCAFGRDASGTSAGVGAMGGSHRRTWRAVVRLVLDEATFAIVRYGQFHRCADGRPQRIIRTASMGASQRTVPGGYPSPRSIRAALQNGVALCWTIRRPADLAIEQLAAGAVECF